MLPIILKHGKYRPERSLSNYPSGREALLSFIFPGNSSLRRVDAITVPPT